MDSALLSEAITGRIERPDWGELGQDLNRRGFATLPGLLTAAECRALARLYDTEGRFRSRVIMERHAFGQGEYKYFDYPLPELVQALRTAFYPRLAAVAADWSAKLGTDTTYPPTLERYLKSCHAAGQARPTPLLLKYRAEGYNCLHQDLYGEIAFPLQVAVSLSRPGRDFEGGAFLLVEQRPRAQSRGEAITLRQGEAVVFANSVRPVAGKRGHTRVNLRHGVSRVTAGNRHTLGLIFHDAQ